MSEERKAFAEKTAPAAEKQPDVAENAVRTISGVAGVPAYTVQEFAPHTAAYCLLIPVINEGGRILAELDRARQAEICTQVDVILCDGGSTDGSMSPENLTLRGVNTLLVKRGPGKQGAQLRMGLHFALARGYAGVLTVDGNNKDSIESVPLFLEKLAAGYDFVQGSRFVKGGQAVNTPAVRYWAVRLLHAPVISLAARQWFTDTTNAYRAYSRRYLIDPRVQPLRDIFTGYELLAYLSVRGPQLGMKACEVPVRRAYPKTGATPTKIKGMKGNNELLGCLWGALTGKYNP
ncbi:MAG: glycosyltransferase family 2 protein [Faecalibacterium sp.]|jgi:glycosyltransferase involved in cell wall biosynthesis|nr:glycosyltransferase family 2 protein [Faecalibacterium sp.]